MESLPWEDERHSGSAIVSRLFDDPGAAAVFGSIMRFAKRLGFFDFARVLENESYVTAYATEMQRTDRFQSGTMSFYF